MGETRMVEIGLENAWTYKCSTNLEISQYAEESKLRIFSDLITPKYTFHPKNVVGRNLWYNNI